ncbi:hypothetical protein F4821DRAFT_261239 [Hypoxylon rubiginosum]|uniref:Uncharacterized protein n=1 Tax=Hypoxylon rubiginosum TaxID=110542 RepID=A0ACC0CY59_9PEZI|nr:hypothetical protein F4821DRAFT_261239 [Hypoxylon rubiginosum]
MLPNSVINQPWIPIATSIAIVLFYGTTQDGLDMYRGYAVALGRVFRRPRQASNVTANPGPNHNDDLGDEYTIHEHEEPNWIALYYLRGRGRPSRRASSSLEGDISPKTSILIQPAPSLGTPNSGLGARGRGKRLGALDIRVNQEAQTTVSDFVDFTEYLPSGLVRSLTKIGTLDQGTLDQAYAEASTNVSDLTTTWGQLPMLSAIDFTELLPTIA